MVKKIIDDDMYYWVKYEGITEAFPIVSWKKDTVYRRLKKMVDVRVLKHKIIKQCGTWSYYSFDENYLYLIDTKGERTIEFKDILFGNKSEGNGNKSDSNGLKSEGNGEISDRDGKISDRNGFKSRTKYSSINNTSINNSSINNNIDTIKDSISSTDVQQVIEKWNSLNLQTIKTINRNTDRFKLLSSRIKDYGLNVVLETIDNINKSSFLKGQNKKGWLITFDWLIRPNNFPKVMDGNYTDREVKSIGKDNGYSPGYYKEFKYNDDEWVGL